MFELCTARPPDASETRELVDLYQDHFEKFKIEVQEAAALMGTQPETPSSKNASNVSELAAWTMTANLVLNLDEVVNKN